jgi:lipopolysaccharide heptosyltransferase II
MGAFQVRLLKAIDRRIGRAAYQALVHRQRPRPGAGVLPHPVRKILVLRPGGIGDAVLFFPLLHALRRAFPGARLDVLAERRNVGLFDANDVVDRAYAYDRGSGRDLLTVLQQRYDVAIDTEQTHFLSAIVTYFTGAPIRCGFDTQGRGGLFTHRVGYSDQVYEVRSFLSLACALTGKDQPFDPEQPFFPVREEHVAWARTLLGAVSREGVAVVSPGASMPQRRWAPERYQELIRWFVGKGWRVVIVGGSTDVVAARRATEGIDGNRVINLAGRTSLARTAAMIALADLYVSSDSGPLHIAYGVGTPTVHLFGSGILEKWAPAGSLYRAVHKALPCSPCTRYGYTPPCPYGVECMKQIEVADVIRRVIEVLEDRSDTALARRQDNRYAQLAGRGRRVDSPGSR